MKKGIIVILVIFALGGLMFFMNAPCNCCKSHDSSDGAASDLSMTSPVEAKEGSKTASPQTKYIVYYFHGNFRCSSCKKIESYTEETVRQKFAGQIKKGVISWQVVNVDEPSNKHFVKDYQLFTKSVVLVETRNGKHLKWKNLDKIWELLGDKSKFSSYVENEIKKFTGGA